jgi:Flp pilus assembly protein TadD
MEYLKILRVYSALFLPIVLLACSSAPNAESPQATLNSKSESFAQSAKDKGSSSNNSSKVEKTEQKIELKNENDTLKALKDAIQSGDDESIYREATANLAHNSAQPLALNALGIYYLHKGRPLAAKLFFNKVLQSKPKSSEAYSNMGLVYWQLKETKNAIAAFRKSIEFGGANSSAAINLGSLYLENRDFHKAYSALNLVAASNSMRDLNFLNNIAMAAAMDGKNDEAEKYYKEALSKHSTSKELLYNFAIFQIDHQKKFKEGIETLDRLKLLGLGEDMKNNTNALENRAKAGVK